MAETMKEMDERRARIMALGDGVYGKEFVDNVFSKTEHEKDCDGNVEWCDLCWKEHMLAIARTIRESDQAKKLAVVPEEATREMVRACNRWRAAYGATYLEAMTAAIAAGRVDKE